jgi:formate hydrogenlyase subunit 3/multisubunit Na+/H+ antiporter MnhD subunit
MFLIIGIWGGKRRVYATLKFFLYTFLGSVLMLVSLIYMYSLAGSYGILDFHACGLDITPCRRWLFFAFLRLRREGADVAGAYLAAGCPRARRRRAARSCWRPSC